MIMGFWYSIKDNKATILTTAVTVGIAAAMFLKGCPGTTVQVEGPRESPACGDHFCSEGMESNQYRRDPKTGKEILDSKNLKIPNSDYCKLDCLNGDGVYDAKPVADSDGKYRYKAGDGTIKVARDGYLPVQAPDGTMMEIPNHYLDGTPVIFDDEKSVDYMLKIANEQPCGNKVDATHPVLSRKKIAGDNSPLAMRQRSQLEMEGVFRHPELLRPGDNYFTVLNQRSEGCDSTVHQCDVYSYDACFCPNLQECQNSPPPPPPPPPQCGNAKIDPPAEKCDYRSPLPNHGCAPDERCTKVCTCEKKPVPPPTCGDGKIDPGEQCDPRSNQARGGCSEGMKCDACQCVEDQPKVTRGPCNPENNGVKEKQEDLKKLIDGKADTFRSAYSAGALDKVRVTVTVNVDANGLISGYGVSSTCNGECPNKGVDSAGTFGSLGMVGTNITPPPAVDCYFSITRSSGGN